MRRCSWALPSRALVDPHSSRSRSRRRHAPRPPPRRKSAPRSSSAGARATPCGRRTWPRKTTRRRIAVRPKYRAKSTFTANLPLHERFAQVLRTFRQGPATKAILSCDPVLSCDRSETRFLSRQDHAPIRHLEPHPVARGSRRGSCPRAPYHGRRRGASKKGVKAVVGSHGLLPPSPASEAVTTEQGRPFDPSAGAHRARSRFNQRRACLRTSLGAVPP